MRDMGGEGPRKIADHALQTLVECGRRPFYYFDLFRYPWKRSHLKQEFSQHRACLHSENRNRKVMYLIYLFTRIKRRCNLKFDAVLGIFNSRI